MGSGTARLRFCVERILTDLQKQPSRVRTNRKELVVARSKTLEITYGRYCRLSRRSEVE